MQASGSCKDCEKAALVRDDESGSLVCSSCGFIQPFDNYAPQLGGINGPQGTFVRVGTAGTGSNFKYKERKIVEAQKLIDELLFKLGFSSERSNEVRTMVATITDGEYGEGDWLPVLIGASSYIVRRQSNRALPIAEVASLIGCDVYELGQMIRRVVQFLNLKLPGIDIANSFEPAFRKCGSLNRVSQDTVNRMLKQGTFLVQCAVKWFLTTGRRPLPMIAAVLLFVAQMNQVDVGIENIATETHAGVATTKLRYKELSEALVKVAQALPWGKDVTTKNIIKNAPIVIQYMEMKVRSQAGKKEENLGSYRFDLNDVLGDCFQEEFDYAAYGRESDSQYFEAHKKGGSKIDDTDKLKLSHQSLSLIYSKVCDEASRVNPVGENGGDRKQKRSRKCDLPAASEWWGGKSDMSKKNLLKQMSEKDVGLDALPPCFVSGCLTYEQRRKKINAAKQRINKIMNPSKTNVDDMDELSSEEHLHYKKRRTGTKKTGIDWEDFVIETLLLHNVNEDEIEKGYYKALLDLHVFNSGYE